jgi:2-dehydropantoate 2-reductase
MNIVIIGIGSIGSYIAAMFAQHTDHHLYLIARSNYLTIQEQGIVVEKTLSNESVKAHRFTVVDDINKIPACEFVILAVREAQLANLLPDLRRICLDRTKIICLQNGINFEKKIQKALPNHSLYSGACWIKVSTLGPGSIRHDFGDNIKLGRYSPIEQNVLIDPDDESVKQLLEEAKFKCDLEENIQSIQLTKLALNVPFCILMAQRGKTASEILADSSLNGKREELQQEIIQACQLYGSPIDVEFLTKNLERLRLQPVIVAPSPQKLAEMMKLELPSNVGALLDLMESKGLDLAKLRSLYEHSLECLNRP